MPSLCIAIVLNTPVIVDLDHPARISLVFPLGLAVIAIQRPATTRRLDILVDRAPTTIDGYRGLAPCGREGQVSCGQALFLGDA